MRNITDEQIGGQIEINERWTSGDIKRESGVDRVVDHRDVGEVREAAEEDGEGSRELKVVEIDGDNSASE